MLIGHLAAAPIKKYSSYTYISTKRWPSNHSFQHPTIGYKWEL